MTSVTQIQLISNKPLRLSFKSNICIIIGRQQSPPSPSTKRQFIPTPFYDSLAIANEHKQWLPLFTTPQYFTLSHIRKRVVCYPISQ